MPRQLIPGIEPGGSLAGRSMQPALLIKDAWIELADWSQGAVDFNQIEIFLKLSQEESLNPGHILELGVVNSHTTRDEAGGSNVSSVNVQQDFHHRGTLWVPQFVGVRVQEIGTVVYDLRVLLSYEMVFIPWMEWFILWDFLDNVNDNGEEY